MELLLLERNILVQGGTSALVLTFMACMFVCFFLFLFAFVFCRVFCMCVCFF